MIGLFSFALAVLASPFRSKLRLEAENAVLRHQLIVLRRKPRGRVRLTNHDRWFFIQLYRWFSADPTIEALYRTHWVSQELSRRKRPTRGRESKPCPDLVVVQPAMRQNR